MIAEMPKPTHARHGFREGWFYFRDPSRRLHRFRVATELVAEVREPGHVWRRLGYPEQKCIDDSFWAGSTGYELKKGKFLLFRSSLIERQTGQLCMPWIAPAGTRRGIRSAEHWERFKASWPAPLLAAVLQVGSNPFRTLELFRQVPSAFDLAKDNPRLVGALSVHWEFPAVGRVDWDGVRQIVQLRRRAILGWLGCPATDSAVNLVERMEACDSAQQLLELMAVATTSPYGPALKRTAGWIDSSVVRFLARPQTQDWLDPRLVPAGPNWAYSCKWPPRHSSQLKAQYFMRKMEFIEALLEIGAIDSSGARALVALRGEPKYGTRLLPFLRPHTLPNAPVPSTAHVQRLDSLQSIIVEAEAMQNCIGHNYRLLGAIHGYSALYQVASPVRATLELTHNCAASESSGIEALSSWRIGELRGHQNSKIDLTDALPVFAAFPTVTGLDQWIHNSCSAN